MAITGTITVKGELVGTPSGRKDLEFSYIISAGIGDVQTLTLASGNNTITPPTGSTLCIITPPTANTTTMFLKGVGGDTGVTIARESPTILGLFSAVTFVINAVSEIVGVEFNFI